MIRLEYEMRERGKSQAALAEETGINRVIINKIIRGHEKPWPKWRDALAQALGWPLENAADLFEEIEVQ